MTLLEKYSNRLKVADSVYSKAHGGETMNESKKLMTAVCLNNISKFLTEALDNSVGTQRADMGAFRKFALNLTTVGLPNLIAPELVMVYPMTSFSGYVTYLKYTAGSNKGMMTRGQEINSPFAFKGTDGNYTSSKVASNGTWAQNQTTINLPWNPVVKGSIELTVGDTLYADDGEGNLKVVTTAGTRTEIVDRNGNVTVQVEGRVLGDIKGTVKYGAFKDGTYAAADEPAAITFTQTPAAAEAQTFALAYVYNNVYVPQNDVPLLNAQIDAIPLIAKARRIAVYYSQMAQFQAKQDYGFDLGDKLAEQAVGQLAYEIDNEVIDLLATTAGAPAAELTWDKTLPVGVSKRDHYAGFAEVVGIAKQEIYDRTHKFNPNWMVISSQVLPILSMVDGFKEAPIGNTVGPYFAGVLGGLKVFVSPGLDGGKFLIGVNGSDGLSSVAVYAPYMPIVPTSLMQFNDGGTTQGFSTLYDLKVLNKDLVVAGQVTGTTNTVRVLETHPNN